MKLWPALLFLLVIPIIASVDFGNFFYPGLVVRHTTNEAEEIYPVGNPLGVNGSIDNIWGNWTFLYSSGTESYPSYIWAQDFVNNRKFARAGDFQFMWNRTGDNNEGTIFEEIMMPQYFDDSITNDGIGTLCQGAQLNNAKVPAGVNVYVRTHAGQFRDSGHRIYVQVRNESSRLYSPLSYDDSGRKLYNGQLIVNCTMTPNITMNAGIRVIAGANWVYGRWTRILNSTTYNRLVTGYSTFPAAGNNLKNIQFQLGYNQTGAEIKNYSVYTGAGIGICGFTPIDPPIFLPAGWNLSGRARSAGTPTFDGFWKECRLVNLTEAT